MSNFTPMIGVYIPSITYTSVGPGFVDAIKLEARNLYLPEKKYAVYTEYTSNESKTKCVYAYRQVIGARVDTPASCNPVTSVQYSDDSQRCQYGRFYDYISPDPNDHDGGLNHTLTCFSNKSKIKDLESFTINDRDGIYVIETDEADAAIELIFTFYTLSYDKYDHTNLEYPEDPMAVCSCPQDYIEIGTMTKIVRASTLGLNEEADMEVEVELDMYYDITKKLDQNTTLYLPVDGVFKPVSGLESDDPKIITCGDTIFDEYQDGGSLNSSTDWGNPIVINISDFAKESSSEKLEQGCLSAYIPNTAPYTTNEASTDNQKEYFSPPTFVDISLYKHVSQPLTEQLRLHNLDANSASIMWTTVPTFAVLNVTYNKQLQKSTTIYTPCTILEYIPELGGVTYDVSTINKKLTTIEVAEGELSYLHFTYTGTACIVGRYFSYVLSKLPHTKFNILQYCNNFKFDRPSTSNNACAFFVKRPAYIKDGVEPAAGLETADTSLFTGSDHFKGTLVTDGYLIESTSLYNYLLSYFASDDDINDMYPLNTYFTSIDEQSMNNWKGEYKLPDLTLGFRRINANHEVEVLAGTEDSTITPWINVNKSTYCHIFTTDDLLNLPSILGQYKIYTSDAAVTIPTLYSDTKIPIMSMNKSWGYTHVYTDTSNMILTDRTAKSPSQRFYPTNDFLRMINWVDEFTESDLPLKVGRDPITPTKTKDYEQVLVLSPMLAVDMDESNTIYSNKGDYKVIPAYYYGDAENPDAVLTDYKNLLVNVSKVDADDCTVSVILKMSSCPTSTFIDYTEHSIYALTNTTFGIPFTFTVQIKRTPSFKKGLYVLKFNKFFNSGDRPSLKANNGNILYTYSGKTFQSNYNFIVIMINEDGAGSTIEMAFSVSKDCTAFVSGFDLYQIDLSNSKNLNQVLLNYWYNSALSYFTSSVEVIPDNDSSSFYKLLYDNIIFPSAICAYENFTLFPDADGNNMNGFTKSYKAAYLPKNSIYNVIGLYDAKNMQIIQIDDLPSDVKLEELICYNQPSRYV